MRGREGERVEGKDKISRALFRVSSHISIISRSDSIEKFCDCVLRVAHKVGHL